MSSIIVYILAIALFLLKHFLEEKKGKASVPTVENDEETEVYDESVPEPEIVFMPEEMVVKRKPTSMTEEFFDGDRRQEGSLRVQHSTQYEAAPHKVQTEHSFHKDFDGIDKADERPMVEMNAEKMREALIYQTILQRPEY